MSELYLTILGDTRTPLGLVLTQGGNPVELTGLTAKVYGETDAGDAWITERTTGVTAQPTDTFTVDATTDYVIANDNLLKHGDQIVLSNSGGALPAGLATSTRYFVRDASPNRFKVSLFPDGAAVDITGAGTGTHSFYIVGSVQIDWQDADVDTAGYFQLWVRVYDGDERSTFPADHDGEGKGYAVRVKGV